MEKTKFIRTILKIGTTQELNPKEERRRISAVSILLIVILTMSVFSILHFTAGNYLISILNFLPAVIFLGMVFYIRQKVNASYVYWIIAVCFAIVCSVTTSIKRDNTSYMFWAFLVPPVVFSLLGRRKGFILNLVFFIIYIFLMSVDMEIFPSGPYRTPVTARFAVAYAVLSFMIFSYEASQQILIKYIQREKDKFEKASRFDALTGLPNRMDVMEKIETERARQFRKGNTFTLVIGDVDNFKTINDTYGHDTGDYVLKKIAEIIKDQVRGIDRPARFGGEEFLIMLVETEINDGLRVAERIRREIESTIFSYGKANITVTMTFGLSEFIRDTDSAEDCIKRADQALYAGKSQGKNRVIVS